MHAVGWSPQRHAAATTAWTAAEELLGAAEGSAVGSLAEELPPVTGRAVRVRLQSELALKERKMVRLVAPTWTCAMSISELDLVTLTVSHDACPVVVRCVR